MWDPTIIIQVFCENSSQGTTGSLYEFNSIDMSFQWGQIIGKNATFQSGNDKNNQLATCRSPREWYNI